MVLTFVNLMNVTNMSVVCWQYANLKTPIKAFKIVENTIYSMQHCFQMFSSTWVYVSHVKIAIPLGIPSDPMRKSTRLLFRNDEICFTSRHYLSIEM